MKWKIFALVGVLACVVVLGFVLSGRGKIHASHTVRLHISVTPADKSEFVIAQAKSAQFKYLIGKYAGVKPVLAQKLSVRPLHNSPLVEAQVGVLSREEGRRYVEAFLDTLQTLCGHQVQLALADQSIK